MLKTTLLHPDILRVIARAGHHAKILIADGNYPASTKRGPNAELVCLNLSPGIVTVAQVLSCAAQCSAGRSHQHDGHSAGRSLCAARRAAGVE